MKRYRLLSPLAVLALLVLCAQAASGAPLDYVQVNLTSSVDGLAANFDPNLKNPWGISFSATSPFWVSDQLTNVSTLYNFAGAPQAMVVAIPPGSGGPSGPTGQVFVGGQGFVTASGAAASFVFASLQGTISAWNAGSSAVTQFTSTDGAIYTGLALSGSRLYAADSANSKIDVFDNSFHQTTVSGSFVDPSLPPGFSPYNIQTVGGNLYIEYFQRGLPGGYVGIFDTSGNFIRQISDPHLDSPWGITLAPASFGQFGGDLLVGNFGDGEINAFDPLSGAFLGTLSDALGNPIVNDGLWALGFRAPGGTFDPNALYFVAGINDEADGLFGEIRVVPEPATLGLVGLGVCVLAYARRKRRPDSGSSTTS